MKNVVVHAHEETAAPLASARGATTWWWRKCAGPIPFDGRRGVGSRPETFQCGRIFQNFRAAVVAGRNYFRYTGKTWWGINDSEIVKRYPWNRQRIVRSPLSCDIGHDARMPPQTLSCWNLLTWPERQWLSSSNTTIVSSWLFWCLLWKKSILKLAINLKN